MAGFFRNQALKKCILIAVWGVMLFAIGFGISFYRGVGNKYDAVQDVPIKEISLENVEDGTYEGEYLFETLYAKVKIIVRSNEIKEITLEDFKTEKGDDAASIVDSITDSQSVKVDDISGATDSSRIIKLAVLNALGQ
ncbi:hypothetical protein SDC9_162849 [bioreactor metagenome]|uniref:FMN-binding domain-containing protein n=1 Tax=bioreactor metagenome TaxID=1076179 RepID=A0A645FM77_9ZZZZ|nr:hypothetical protein [Candidatus Metalachnospira sp.]